MVVAHFVVCAVPARLDEIVARATALPEREAASAALLRRVPGLRLRTDARLVSRTPPPSPPATSTCVASPATPPAFISCTSSPPPSPLRPPPSSRSAAGLLHVFRGAPPPSLLPLPVHPGRSAGSRPRPRRSGPSTWPAFRPTAAPDRGCEAPPDRGRKRRLRPIGGHHAQREIRILRPASSGRAPARRVTSIRADRSSDVEPDAAAARACLIAGRFDVSAFAAGGASRRAPPLRLLGESCNQRGPSRPPAAGHASSHRSQCRPSHTVKAAVERSCHSAPSAFDVLAELALERVGDEKVEFGHVERRRGEEFWSLP